MNKLLQKVAKIFLGLSMVAGVGVGISAAKGSVKETAPIQAAGTTVKYTVSTKTSVTTSGTAPTGSSATFNSTANTANQLTYGKKMDLTLTGFDGLKITGLTLSMKSNSSKGKGSMSFKSGSNTICSVNDLAFNNSAWYGAWSTSFVTITWPSTNHTLTERTVGTGESLTFNITNHGSSNSTNSLYCEWIQITYEAAASDYVGSLSVSPSTWTGYDSQTLSVSSFTVSGSKNGTAGAVTSSDYEYKGIGYMSSGNFVARNATFSSGNPTTADTRLAWKAKYPTTAGGSTYAWAYVTLTVSADSVNSIAISGSMTKTTYNQGDAWDPAGFTVKAYYASAPSTPVDVTNNAGLSWSYSPATTDSTSTTKVACTASFEGKSATSSDQSVTINERQNLGGIVSGEKYFIIASWAGTEYYLNGFSSTSSGSALGLEWPGDENVPEDDTDAWTFTQGSDTDVWKITSEEYSSQLYSISDNNGLRATANPTDDDEWEVEEYNSNIYLRNTKFDGAKGEYLTVYSTPDFRTYSSRTAQDAQGGTPAIIRFVHYIPPKTLDSLSISGATSTFTAGDYFSLGSATITASYSDGDVVIANNDSGLSFKLGGTTITTSTRLTNSDNGKSLVVRYTDAEERYADATGYALTINPKAVQSVELDKSSATISKSGTVNLTATVTDEYAIQTVKWTTSSSSIATLSAATSTSGNSITVTGSSSNTGSATITAYVDENGNDSLDSGEKSATCTVTVSGDPVLNMFDESSVNVTSGSINKFTTSANFYLSVVAESFQGSISYTWTSSNTSAVSVYAEADEMCEFAIAGSGNARLSCRAVGSTTGDLTVYVDVSVKVPAVTSVTWSASDINVYSNASLTSSIVSSWNVQYEKEDSSSGNLSFGDYDLYIGSTKITSLSRQWTVSDDGKTMHVEYGNVSSSSVSVTVTQYVNTITKTTTEDHNFSWAQTVSSPAAFAHSDTSVTLGGVSWTKNEQSETFTVQGSGTRRYLQIGRSATANSLTLRTSGISGTITRIAVDCAKGSAGTSTLSVTVGGETFIPSTTMASYTNNVGSVISNTGSASGEVVISMTASGSSGKQMYLHSIEIDYTTSSSETISNSESHKVAQRVAVAFAKAFNDAMDDTEYCTTGLSTAWSTCSTAYNTFKTEAAKLSSAEETYAKDLIKCAFESAKYTDDSREACIERMLQTYKVCVQKHGQTAFMNDLITVNSAPYVSPLLSFDGKNTNTILIIVIISMVSVTAIGGYFFLRKRKENN